MTISRTWALDTVDASSLSTSALSMTERIYQDLRTRIITNIYAEGSKLPEARLAAELGVSRVPVREALALLERDGFVDTHPRRSAVVRIWDTREVVELFDVRLGLEPLAARLAAQRAAEGKSLTTLNKAMTKVHVAIDSHDPLKIAETNAALHGAIVEFSENALLQQLMRTIISRMAWLFFITSDRDTASQCEEHHQLIDAIATGNQRLAEYAMLAHTEEGREPTLGVVDRLRMA